MVDASSEMQRGSVMVKHLIFILVHSLIGTMTQQVVLLPLSSRVPGSIRSSGSHGFPLESSSSQNMLINELSVLSFLLGRMFG